MPPHDGPPRYSDVVLGLDLGPFEKLLERAKARRGVALDSDLEAEDLEALVKAWTGLLGDIRQGITRGV